MKNTNSNTKQPWRGRGGGRGNTRKGPGGGRGQQGQRQDGTKKDKKIHQFVPFTSHNASTHHTYSDTKENFVRAASIKLGEYANDVRNALETEVAYVGARPTRGQAAPMTTMMPVRIVKRDGEADGTFEERIAANTLLINTHLQEKAQHDFAQATLDMEGSHQKPGIPGTLMEPTQCFPEDLRIDLLITLQQQVKAVMVQWVVF